MSNLAVIEKTRKPVRTLADFVLEGQLELETETRERERVKAEAERIKQQQLRKADDLAQSVAEGLMLLKEMPRSRFDFSLREESSRLVITTNIPLRERNELLEHSHRRMDISIPRDGTEKLRLGIDPFYTHGSEMDDSLCFEGAHAVPEALAVIARYAGKKGIIQRA